MGLKNSLAAKITAFCLMILFVAGSVGGVLLSGLLLFNLETYKDNYTSTESFLLELQYDARQVNEYYILRQKGDDLTAEELDRMKTLKGLLYPLSGGNVVWALIDADNNCLLSNLTDFQGTAEQAMDLVKEQTGGTQRQQQFDDRYVVLGLRENLVTNDYYSDGLAEFTLAKRWTVPLLLATVSCMLLTVFLFGFLIAAAGHKRGCDEIVLSPFDRIWTEVILTGEVLFGVLALSAMMNGFYYVDETILYAVLGLAGALVLFFSLVRRAKAKMLYKTSLLYLFVRFCRVIMRHIKITARIIAFVLVFALLQLLLILGMANGSFIAGFFFFTTNLTVTIVVCLAFIQYQQICKATERMAAGELDSRINENAVPFFHHIAHNLNSTGEAMDRAVAQATQSERMKTELITNVSHDIKTPLTSIISYVGLLRTTAVSDPKALEYIDVLDRKSRRLGQLMADLVDASKVTSGNVSVEMEVINLGELVKQAGGEFESRLGERGIRLIGSLPENPVFVEADGRHMWRVLDNLFGNACKYALDGTRVYVDLNEIGDEVLLSIKNVSRDPLNFPPEELMERFVRGDESRHTEGSGLGLSIARSLMELQGGSMNIQIDGDLFKVVLGMKRAAPPAPPTAIEDETPSPPSE